MDIQFEINIIVVKEEQTKIANKFLKDNCSYVDNNVYIYEGDIGCLDDDNVKYNLEDVVIVGCVGGMSRVELVKMLNDDLGLDIYKLKFKQ